jgi:hypothetical protein
VKGEIKVSLKYFINKERTVILYKVYKIIRCRGTEVNEYVWPSLEKYRAFHNSRPSEKGETRDRIWMCNFEEKKI